MIEERLQQEINLVITEAKNHRLELITVEHLLIALLNISEVVSFLRGKLVNIDEMRAELERYIDSHTPVFPEDVEPDIVPSSGFHRVLATQLFIKHNVLRGTL